jgi:hypothetical protein
MNKVYHDMVGFEICINRSCSGSGMWVTTISDTQIECLFKCFGEGNVIANKR